LSEVNSTTVLLSSPVRRRVRMSAATASSTDASDRMRARWSRRTRDRGSRGLSRSSGCLSETFRSLNAGDRNDGGTAWGWSSRWRRAGIGGALHLLVPPLPHGWRLEWGATYDVQMKKGLSAGANRRT
jgi:hypothetical protein